jgi:hypothetical protein
MYDIFPVLNALHNFEKSSIRHIFVQLSSTECTLFSLSSLLSELFLCLGAKN